MEQELKKLQLIRQIVHDRPTAGTKGGLGHGTVHIGRYRGQGMGTSAARFCF